MPKLYHFNPYHQRIDEAMAKTPPGEAIPADTEWPVWEVFQQAKRGEHHVHVGSLHAPDAETALLLAREQYVRRGTAVSLWVAPADAILATRYDDPDFFARTSDKSYRENVGYRAFRQGRVKGEGRKAKGGEEMAVAPAADPEGVVLPRGSSGDG